jgi:hypothetical protein
VKRPKLTASDRLFWTGLSGVWAAWRSALVIVRPDTVIAWHRKAFRLLWTWKIHHGRSGRPKVSADTRALIRKMSGDNPLWGAPRIHGELLKLGIHIGETSVSKYLVRHRKPPSQTSRTFLENHVKSMVSVDFFTVPTIRFEVLYVFVVLAHERRRIVHFGVTAHPTAEWTAQQLREAFPWDTAPRYLLRDRDAIFGGEFVEQVKAFGIKQVLSAPRSPCLASAHQSVLEYRRVSMRVSRPQINTLLEICHEELSYHDASLNDRGALHSACLGRRRARSDNVCDHHRRRDRPDRSRRLRGQSDRQAYRHGH